MLTSFLDEGNMILIKDRHPPSVGFKSSSFIGKYDTYKGSAGNFSSPKIQSYFWEI